MWKFICYNGTEFLSRDANIFNAILEFKQKCNLHEMDIKSITNVC
jgi:hypothetical protein